MPTVDFFRSRLVRMIDLKHPLAVLATRLPKVTIEATMVPRAAHKAKPGLLVAGEVYGRCGIRRIW